MPSLEEQNRIGCEKSDPAYTTRPDSGCTLAVMTISGRNQNASGSDPACLLDKHHVYYILVSRFGLAQWCYAGKREDLGSIPLRLLSIQKGAMSIGELTLGPFPCQLSPGGDVSSA